MERLNGYIHAAYNLGQLISVPLLLPAILLLFGKSKYRRMFPMRMGVGIGKKSKERLIRTRRVWVHCLSLGEFNGAIAFIDALCSALPDFDLVISSTTASGFDALTRSKFASRAFITAMPYDAFPVVRRFVRILRPEVFILVETDIWPNLLWTLRNSGVENILINGSISVRSAHRLSCVKPLARYLYGPFSVLAMQSMDDARRLSALGMGDRVRVVGNMKFDVKPVALNERDRKRMLEIAGFDENQKILVAGSTHEPEEELCLKVLKGLRKQCQDLGMVVAPRDISRGEGIERMFREAGFRVGSRSKGMDGGHSGQRTDVFVLDSLGELSAFYGICTMAFVGGSIAPVGGHNILEPIGFGRPVLFGPFMESFREIAEEVERSGCGRMVKNEDEFIREALVFLKNEHVRRKVRKAADELMERNRGAVAKYVELIEEVVKQKSKTP